MQILFPVWHLTNDPNKGPIYAYGMMNKTGVDIFHYLNGRLRYCAHQKQHAQAQKLGFMNKNLRQRET